MHALRSSRKCTYYAQTFEIFIHRQRSICMYAYIYIYIYIYINSLCICMHALTAIHEPTHHGQIFEIFMNFGSAPENCQKASEQTMTIIRLYGALILAQSWLVWRTRMVADPFVVRWFLRMWLACVHICMYVCMYVCMHMRTIRLLRM